VRCGKHQLYKALSCNVVLKPSLLACRACIEQIDDVVEEEEDEITQAARLSSNAEASPSESQTTVVR